METKHNKTVIITGSGKGIGRACALRFSKAGWNIVAIDRDGSTLESLRKHLRPSDILVPCSTLDTEALTRAVTEAVNAFGAVDCVVANAGIHRSDTILTVTDSALEEVIGTNIIGTVRTLQCALPAMSSGGSIIIMASDQSTVGKAHSFSYGLAKGALGQITKSMAIDLAPMGIRVNAVCPSTIATPLVDGVFDRCVAEGADLDELWREENALFLRGTVGQPEEVAAMVYFLASEDAAFCTGGLYPVDGGYTCR